jgi:L-fuculose-phosphate aldolase
VILRVFLFVVMALLVIRAVGRLFGGMAQGARGAGPRTARGQSATPVKMTQDPVCGTFVVPGKALSHAVVLLRALSIGVPEPVMTPTEQEARAGIVEVGRRLWQQGFVASNDGNISVRLDGDRILTTPKSVSKGFMTPEMMVVTDRSGVKLAGERDASSELKMHLEVYDQRPDVGAVVHAHPATATGFAVAGVPLTRAVLAEVITTLGGIPIAEYATPSTAELPAAIRAYIKSHDGLLLANHGALAVGADLFTAYHRMETIEHFAKISLVARLLGREHLLSRQEVERLQGLRGMYGIASPAPICADDTAEPDCQIVDAPSSPHQRLVPDTPVLPSPRVERTGTTGEIRLTYGELTALIDEAVRGVRGK